MENEQIVLQVDIDTQKVQQNLSLAISKVASLKESQKALRAEIEKGNDKTGELAATYAQYGKQLEQAQREIKSNTAALQMNTAAVIDENSSLDEQRMALNAAQKAYALLSGEAKKAADAEGGLRDQIDALSNRVKEQEAAIGDYRRNVGNYTEVITAGFDQMEKAAGQLSPAVGILRSMGGEGKKLGDALDMLGKVMQVVSKGGKVVAATTNAQKVATEGQTVAQQGLNAAMKANPIGLIITAMTTLLPLIQTFISSTSGAEDAQKALNAELERQNNILTTLQHDYDFAARLAAAEGKSQMEVLQIRLEGAKKEEKIAYETQQRLFNERLKMNKKQKEATKEQYEQAVQAYQTAAANVKAINEEITIADTKANTERTENAKKAAQQRAAEKKKAAEKEAEELAKIQEAAEAWSLAQTEDTARKRREVAEQAVADLQAANAKALEQIDEYEEEENVPTVEEMARNVFGLDEEGVRYFQELLAQGVEAQEAADKAMSGQLKRKVKEYGDAFGAMGSAFGDMANMLGEFAEENEEAAKAQKAFALMGILLNQAQSISQGALAIAEGVSSAAMIPFPGNIPAIISIVAQITALMAGVGSSIAQAKQLFAQADAQKFATGGIVGGSSYTGDHVPVLANSGEMFINSDSQKRLFDALTGNGDGSLGMNYEMLAAAFASAPAPVVVYSELQEFGQRVSTYKEIASI